MNLRDEINAFYYSTCLLLEKVWRFLLAFLDEIG